MRLSMLVSFFLGISAMIAGSVAVWKAATGQLAFETPSSATLHDRLKLDSPATASAEAAHFGKNWIEGDSLEAMRKHKARAQAGAAVDPLPANYTPGGRFYIDTLAFTGRGVRGTFNAEAIVDSAGTIELVGWAIDTVQKNSGQSVQLVFASKDEIKVIETEREERVDIVNVYHSEGYRHSGFIARTSVSGFKPGEYRIYVRVNCTDNAGCQQHDTGRKLNILVQQQEEEF